MNKREARQRRARKTRSNIRIQVVHRLTVHRTPRHIYAQVIAPDGGTVVTSASTLDKKLRKQIKYGGNAAAAALIGKEIAERAKQAGVTKVAFDRAGFKYHGRIRAHL